MAYTNTAIFILSFYCTAKYIVQISINKRWTAIEKWKCADRQNIISVFSGPRAQMVCKSQPFLKYIPEPRKLTPCTPNSIQYSYSFSLSLSLSLPLSLSLSLSLFLSDCRDCSVDFLNGLMNWWILGPSDLSLLLWKTSNFVLTSTYYCKILCLKDSLSVDILPANLRY